MPIHSLQQGRVRTASRQAGVTLIELMVAITLDLIIVAGVAGLYVSNSSYRNQVERAGQQIENGRYAMQSLADDLQMAGYLGQLDVLNAMATPNRPSLGNPPTNFWPSWPWAAGSGDPLPANPCDNTVNGMHQALPYHVQAFTAASAPTCVGADVKANTDIILIRRTAGCIGGATADCAMSSNSLYFQASSCNNGTELGAASANKWFSVGRLVSALDRTQRDCLTLAEAHQILVHIYFIANNDVAGDGIPTLKRAELIGTGWVINSVASGIQDLHLEYGIDNAPIDGIPDAWTVSPASFNGCAAADCEALNAFNIMAVKVNLLARSLSTRNGYTDTKTYTLGLNAAGAPYVVGPFADAYERHSFNATVRMTNPSIRRQL